MVNIKLKVKFPQIKDKSVASKREPCGKRLLNPLADDSMPSSVFRRGGWNAVISDIYFVW